jgi:hypothetical protein
VRRWADRGCRERAGSPPGVGRAGTSEWGVAGIMSFIASTTTKARCRSMDGL